MSRISGREALAAGFHLIRREPAAVLAWSVIALLLGVAPQLLSVSASLQMLGALAAGGDPTGPEVLAAQQQAMAYAPLSYLSSLAILTLIPSAVFRATLQPDDRRFLYLRLSAAEFWMVVIVLVMVVMYVVAILVGMIPFMIVIFIVAAVTGGAGGAAVGGVLTAIMILALFGVIVWGALRFSMAPIMAFADRTFRLTESWALTKGHAGKMFLVGLTLAVITLVVEVVVFGFLFLTAGGVAGMAKLAEASSQGPPAIVQALGAPWLVMIAVVFGLFSGVAYTVWAGAWAEMYRQLRPGVGETFT